MKVLLVAILSLLPNYVFMEDLWHHADWPAGAAVASRGRGDGIDHHAHDIEVCISIFELIEMSYAHTIRKVKFLSKNSILTKPQHFHEFFTHFFLTIFSGNQS